MLRIAPTIAIPNALPTSRETSLTAEATPCLSAGSELVIAVVAGVEARAIPNAKRARPVQKCVYEKVNGMVLNTYIPMARKDKPNEPKYFCGMVLLSTPATRDIGSTINGTSMSLSTACHGVKP